MDQKELAALRAMLDDAISKQIKAPSDAAMARAVANVVTGMAFDLGRIADAIETIAYNQPKG